MKSMKNPRSFTRSSRVTSRLRIVTASTLILAAAAMAVFAARPARPPAADAAPVDNGVYIVQMMASPAASYTGDVAGYAATKPKKGEKIDPIAANTVRYVGYLKGKHDQALRKVHGGAKIYDYAIELQWVCRKTHAETGRGAQETSRRPRGDKRRAPSRHHIDHADFPRSH